MTVRATDLLTLPTEAERQRWLAHHFPQKDVALIEQLRAEAEQRERINPRTVEPVAQSVATAAAFWQDQATMAVALLISANLQRLLGEQESALAAYGQAIQIYDQLGLQVDAARAVIGQIDVLMNLGHHQEALHHAAQASAVLRTAGDSATLAKLLVNQGNIYARQKDFAAARISYAEARQIFGALGNRPHLASVTANEAMICLEVDDYLQAEALFNQSRHHFAEAAMDNAVALVDHSRAHLALAQGDYQRALLIADRARTTLVAQDSPMDVAFLDLDRCEMYLALNLWQEALALAQTTRRVFATASMVHECAQLWLNEAVALAQMGQLKQAVAALYQARQLFAEGKHIIWLAIVDLYQATFDRRAHLWHSARRDAQQAFTVFQTVGLRKRTAECHLLLGEIALAEQDLRQARVAFQAALTLFAATPLPAITFAGAYGLGRAYQQQSDFSQATVYFQHAIAALEQLQATIGAEDYKIAFRRDKVQVYEALLLLTLAATDTETMQVAFQTSERARSRTLLDALTRTAALAAQDETENQNVPTEQDALLATVGEHKRALHWFYSRLNRATPDAQGSNIDQRSALITAITTQEAALSRLLNRWRAPDRITAPNNPLTTVTPTQLQALLPAGTLFLAYYLIKDQIIVWGVTQTTLWQQSLAVPREHLRELLEQLRFQLSKFNYGPAYRHRHAAMLQHSVQLTLQRLHALLVEPLAAALTAPAIIIAPHDLLHYVPFHALFDGCRYWLEEKTITYIPSATLLQQLMREKPPTMVGPPVLLGIADERLPHIHSEMCALRTLFPDAALYMDEEARMERFLDQPKPPAFLHLATHAAFRQDNPLFSALKLADGWVTVNDLYGLRHAPPLVTLSACETGRNLVDVGDELVGLCRGFFSAGAQTLVASLWAVDDQATTALMTDFYRNLLAGQAVGCALRNAQLTTLARWRHPFYWAAFTATGNPWLQLLTPLLSGS